MTAPSVMAERAVRVCAVLLLLAVVAGVGGCRDAAPDTPATGTGPRADSAAVELLRFDFGGDFVLTDQHGGSFDLAKGRGRVHLLFFGFTRCPDVCPMTLSRIARAFDQLTPAERADIVTLFVTVDVDRDTPTVLAHHLTGFSVPVLGLTGTRAQIDTVVGQYRASYEITPSTSAAGPSVSHSTYLYLIDRDGRVRRLFRLGDGPEQIAAGLRLALQAPREAVRTDAR